MNASKTQGEGPEKWNEPAKEANEPAACGPGCDCGSPSGSGRAKLAISLVVLLTVAGIIAYKALNGRQPDGSNILVGREEAGAFNIAATAQNAALEKESAAQDKVEPNKVAAPAKEDARIGKYLKSMSELNKVALDQDAVFIFLPGKRDEVASDTTSAAVLSAQKALKSKNIKVGLYTLQTASPDYSAMSVRVQVPAVLVVCKGRGMGAVSGELTETKLLLAFMASSRAGGCGPSGCGPSGCQ